MNTIALTWWNAPNYSVDVDGHVYCEGKQIFCQKWFYICCADGRDLALTVRDILAETWGLRPENEWAESKYADFLRDVQLFNKKVESGELVRCKFRKKVAVDRYQQIYISRDGTCYYRYNLVPITLYKDEIGRVSINYNKTAVGRAYVDDAVAATFIPVPEQILKIGCFAEDLNVIHLDGDMSNNNVCNLAWGFNSVDVNFDDLSVVHIDGIEYRSLAIFNRGTFYININGSVFNLRTQSMLRLQQHVRQTGSLYVECYKDNVKQRIGIDHAVAVLWKNDPIDVIETSVYKDVILRYRWFDEEVAAGRLKPTRFKNIDGDPYYVHINGEIYSYKYRKPMTLTLDGHGYKSTSASNNNIRSQVHLHRVLAEEFIPIPDEYIKQGLRKEDLSINHIDGNKQNNALSNLEWCTQTENMQKARDIGLYTSERYDPVPGEMLLDIVHGLSDKEIADKYGTDDTVIFNIRYHVGGLAKQWWKRHHFGFYKHRGR